MCRERPPHKSKVTFNPRCSHSLSRRRVFIGVTVTVTPPSNPSHTVPKRKGGVTENLAFSSPPKKAQALVSELTQKIHQRLIVAHNADFPLQKKIGQTLSLSLARSQKTKTKKNKNDTMSHRARRFWPPKKTKSKLSDSISCHSLKMPFWDWMIWTKHTEINPHSLSGFKPG